MRVLVTGGAGFIDSHLAEHYHQQAEVRVLDDFSSGHADNLAGLQVELHRGSITDREAVAAAMEDVDYVFHLAAMVSVPESMQRPVARAEANVLSLLNVIEEADAAAEVKKLRLADSITNGTPDEGLRATIAYFRNHHDDPASKRPARCA